METELTRVWTSLAFVLIVVRDEATVLVLLNQVVEFWFI